MRGRPKCPCGEDAVLSVEACREANVHPADEGTCEWCMSESGQRTIRRYYRGCYGEGIR